MGDLHILAAHQRDRTGGDATLAMLLERDRCWGTMLWALGPDRCAPGEILLRAALGELGTGARIDPPGLEDYG